MVLYTSTMVPSIVPKTSSTMLYERDSLAELTARENEVYQELDKIRWYQFQGSGRIFGAERQQQEQQEALTEAGNASHSSGSRLDGPDEGIDMETDETSSTSEDDDLFGGDGDDEIYIESQHALDLFDDPDEDTPDEFW